MYWIGFLHTTNLVCHPWFLSCTNLWWGQLPLLPLGYFLNHICHDQHPALELLECANLSLWKFLSSKSRHFKDLCFQITFHKFPFFSYVVLSLSTYWWRTGYFCHHFCGWHIFFTCFFLEFQFPSASVISGKSFSSTVGSSVGSFCSSPSWPEITFSNSSLAKISSIA